MIISVDYDGTIVDDGFPKIGVPKEGAIPVLKALYEDGHRLVLWTCREDEPGKLYLSQAVNNLEAMGVTLHSVNETHPHDEFRDSELKRKVYADVYIDDKNFGGFPGWEAVARDLLKWEHDQYLAAVAKYEVRPYEQAEEIK